MRNDNIVDLRRKRLDKQAAQFKAQLDKATRGARNFPRALHELVAAARYGGGVSAYHIARALRECEEVVQEMTRTERGHRKPGPKSNAS